jgi:hypothetical protein
MWVRAGANRQVQSDSHLCPCVQVKERRTLSQPFPKTSDISVPCLTSMDCTVLVRNDWRKCLQEGVQITPGQFPEYRDRMHWMLQNLRPVQGGVPLCEGPTTGPFPYMWEPTGS